MHISRHKICVFRFSSSERRYLFPQTLFTEIPVQALEITEWNYCFYCRCSSINANTKKLQSVKHGRLTPWPARSSFKVHTEISVTTSVSNPMWSMFTISPFSSFMSYMVLNDGVDKKLPQIDEKFSSKHSWGRAFTRMGLIDWQTTWKHNTHQPQET